MNILDNIEMYSCNIGKVFLHIPNEWNPVVNEKAKSIICSMSSRSCLIRQSSNSIKIKLCFYSNLKEQRQKHVLEIPDKTLMKMSPDEIDHMQYCVSLLYKWMTEIN